MNVLFLTKKMIPQAAGTRSKNDEKSPKSEEKFFGMQKPPRREACKKELAVGRALTEAFLKVPLGIMNGSTRQGHQQVLREGCCRFT